MTELSEADRKAALEAYAKEFRVSFNVANMIYESRFDNPLTAERLLWWLRSWQLATQAARNNEIESAWLIERHAIIGRPVLYLTVVCGFFDWTHDHEKATRFSRRADAEMVAAVVGDDVDSIVEHAWHVLAKGDNR